MPEYSVTKAAMLSLSRLVADLYAKDGIRCNAVTPGPTATGAWLGDGGLADQQGDRDEVLAKVGAGRPLGRLARARGDRRRDRLPLLRRAPATSPARRGAPTAAPSRSSSSLRSRDGQGAGRGTRWPMCRAAACSRIVRRSHPQLEEHALSPLAVRSYETRGRLEPEDESDVRTPFQRDRDRIVHSKPFRRLKGKTQVFIDPAGDHYRTRMTHTLETTGIARVVARALRLNEDLVEAIGLGHDTGHTPFGHAGEEALDEALRERFGGRFRHNEQSLRIAERLNLTYEVRDGILTHTGEQEPETLEGKIVRIVDRVAYINHDIDDAIRYGLLEQGDLPRDEIAVLGPTGSKRIDTLVHDLIETSARAGDIVQSDEVGAAMLSLRSVHVRARLPRPRDAAPSTSAPAPRSSASSTRSPTAATAPTRSPSSSPA